MPSWSSVLKREWARPSGSLTLEARLPAEAEVCTGQEQAVADLERKREEAEALLARAQRQAQALVQEGEAKRASIEKEAYEAGYRRGYEEALARAREEAEEIRAEAKALLAEARRVREEIIAASEPEVVALAVAVAGAVVHRQLQVAPDTVVAVARAALRRLRRRQHLVVYAHPEDLEWLRAERQSLQQELGEEATLHFLADPAVARGGCRVESEGGQVDATVDGQLERLRQALFELVPSVGQAVEARST